MKATRKRSHPVSVDKIARLAVQGEDVSCFFTNSGRMMDAVERTGLVLDAERRKNAAHGASRGSTEESRPAPKGA